MDPDVWICIKLQTLSQCYLFQFVRCNFANAEMTEYPGCPFISQCTFTFNEAHSICLNNSHSCKYTLISGGTKMNVHWRLPHTSSSNQNDLPADSGRRMVSPVTHLVELPLAEIIAPGGPRASISTNQLTVKSAVPCLLLHSKGDASFYFQTFWI